MRLSLVLALCLTGCSVPAIRYSPAPKPVPILHEPGDVSAAGVVTPRLGLGGEHVTVALEGQGHAAIALPYHIALLVTANGSVLPERDPDYAHRRAGIGIGAYDLIAGPWAADVLAGFELGEHVGNGRLANGVEYCGLYCIDGRPRSKATYTASSYTRFALLNVSYDYEDGFRQTLSIRLSDERFRNVTTDSPRLNDADVQTLLLEPQLSAFVPMSPAWGFTVSAGASFALIGEQPSGYKRRTYYGAFGYQWRLNR